MEGLRSPNRKLLEAVAGRIRPLLPEVVFVGGQVVELLITDAAAIRTRPTTDVDLLVATATKSKYHDVEEQLRGLGFSNDTSEGAPICRWVDPEGHRLDLLPVDTAILGFSNPWYPLAVQLAERHALREDLIISIPRASVFFATKLAAYLGRGRHDMLSSHDLEDVITLVAGRSELPGEVRREREDLRDWIAEQISYLLEHEDFAYALQGALPDAALMPEYLDHVRARFAELAART